MALFSKRRVLGIAIAGALLLVLCLLATIGARTLYRVAKARAHLRTLAGEAPVYGRRMPVSTLPGPTRTYGPPGFRLTDDDSQTMTGSDDPVNERWCDIAGNFYASTFISQFSYAHPGENGPLVRVRISPEGPTLRGRLEAHGLKPYFAYQIKLRGVFDDRRGFEAIGRVGRWRLPGRGTNYSDLDYREYPFKDQIEAYVLFDFFITDGRGDAVRDFALDSSLHVLWNASRQAGEGLADDMIPVIVDPSDASRYARPKRRRTLELIWAEREFIRYESADQVIRLPAGAYVAELMLTEESFHSLCNDGGYWATPFKVPIAFTIAEPPVPAREPE